MSLTNFSAATYTSTDDSAANLDEGGQLGLNPGLGGAHAVLHHQGSRQDSQHDEVGAYIVQGKVGVWQSKGGCYGGVIGAKEHEP